VLVGYRWNDAKKVPAAFPFGFGLTYGSFEFSDFEATCSGSEAVVSLKVANLADRGLWAVPQLYVGFPSLKPALRQLRGFSKVWVEGGSSSSAAFALSEADWSYYDEAASKWMSALKKGEKVTVSVGSSSTDLLWNQTLDCKEVSGKKKADKSHKKKGKSHGSSKSSA
jgi:beta-glucosidase